MIELSNMMTAQEFFELYCGLKCLKEDEKRFNTRIKLLCRTSKLNQIKLLDIPYSPNYNKLRERLITSLDISDCNIQHDDILDTIQVSLRHLTRKLELLKPDTEKALKWYQVREKYNQKFARGEEDKLKEDVHVLTLLITKYKAGDMPTIHTELKTLSEKIDNTQSRIREMSERLRELCEHSPTYPIPKHE